MVKENTSKKLALGDAFLSVRGITKEFSTVRVLDQIDLDIKAGEVMGLIGENGAGKSTLIKIISGIYQPTAGSVYLNGEEVSIRNYAEAKALGISIVPQEFNLINTLTVYENIFLGNEVLLRSGLLDKGTMRRQSIEQLEQLKMSLNVNRLVGDLSVAEKQMVEISKALMLHARILIMDEPTTMLTGHEVETLFNLMRELKRQGVTIIFVSHKLKEVKAICDRVTVLRDGLLISVDPIEEVEEKDLARKMIGRDFTQVFPAKKIRDRDDIILEVKDFGVRNLIHDVSFSLRRGEILGFAGLVGAGRTELFEAIMGLRRVEGGTIAIDGEEVKIRHPRDAVNLGMGYISEDRQGKGIVANFDVPKNITLITLSDYKKRLLIDFKKEERRAEEFRKTFRIVAA
ncbi:MAG: sugar ABC transporter ATP-binding protein, partial [Spirochaetales bacterium]|nr:sugar ABC transporter ATP-binding protein [Spirochaetales bacterium]